MLRVTLLDGSRHAKETPSSSTPQRLAFVAAVERHDRGPEARVFRREPAGRGAAKRHDEAGTRTERVQAREDVEERGSEQVVTSCEGSMTRTNRNGSSE